MSTPVRTEDQLLTLVQQCSDLALVYRSGDDRSPLGVVAAERVRELSEEIEITAADGVLNSYVNDMRRKWTTNITYARRRHTFERLHRDPSIWRDEVKLLAKYLPEDVVLQIRMESADYILQHRPPAGFKRPKKGKTQKNFRIPKYLINGRVQEPTHGLASKRPVDELVGRLSTRQILQYENTRGIALTETQRLTRSALFERDLCRLHAAIILIADILKASQDMVEVSYALAVGITRC